jgi:uncharacterized FlgJ-related protein
MPGCRHPPLEDIQRIRQDLRDRNLDGFAMVNELLQNADDAGAIETDLEQILTELGLATRVKVETA